MTKLDEIQEAIKAVGNVPDDRISSKEAVAITLSLLNQTVEELKRIDADVKRQRVMPPSPDSANLEW